MDLRKFIELQSTEIIIFIEHILSNLGPVGTPLS